MPIKRWQKAASITTDFGEMSLMRSKIWEGAGQ
jgi:hypothetical protein